MGSVRGDWGLRRRFFRYVSLNMLGMTGLSCYILADTFFIAQGVGSDGLTALNLVLPAYSLIHGVGLMIGMGGATRYAISREESVFPTAAALAALAAAIFLPVGLLFTTPLARLLGAEGDVLPMAVEYLQVILLFAPMFLANNLLICFVRNDGGPRLAMTAMVGGSFSNIVLDYVFIFPLGMGMFGAALATGIAPVVSMLVLSLHFRGGSSFSLRRGRVLPGRWGDLTALGLPSLIGELSSGVVILAFNFLLLELAGNLAVAAYGIVANAALVITALFTGAAQGIQPLVSGAWGRGRPQEARQLIAWGVMLTIVLAAAVYLLAAVLFPAPIVSAFNRQGDPQLAAMAEQGLRLYFIAFFFQGINIVAATGFSAMEQPRWGFLISLLRGLVLVVPTALFLAWLLGIVGVWLTTAAVEAMVAGITLVMMRQEKTVKE